MNILTFLFNVIAEFVKSSFFTSFGYIVMAMGFIICIIVGIRRIIRLV